MSFDDEVVELMSEDSFTVTVRCGSSTFCLVATDVREACIEAEHYIRNVSGPCALVFEITGAAPETARIIRHYLSNLRVEILTDYLVRNIGRSDRDGHASGGTT